MNSDKGRHMGHCFAALPSVLKTYSKKFPSGAQHDLLKGSSLGSQVKVHVYTHTHMHARMHTLCSRNADEKIA